MKELTNGGDTGGEPGSEASALAVKSGKVGTVCCCGVGLMFHRYPVEAGVGSVRLGARGAASFSTTLGRSSEGAIMQVLRLCRSGCCGLVPASADLGRPSEPQMLMPAAHFPQIHVFLYLSSCASNSEILCRSCSFSHFASTCSCSKRPKVRSTFSARLKGNSHELMQGWNASSALLS